MSNDLSFFGQPINNNPRFLNNQGIFSGNNGDIANNFSPNVANIPGRFSIDGLGGNASSIPAQPQALDLFGTGSINDPNAANTGFFDENFLNPDGSLNFDNLASIGSFGNNLLTGFLANQANNDNRRSLNQELAISKAGFNNNVSQIQGELNDRAERRRLDGSGLTSSAPQLNNFGG